MKKERSKTNNKKTYSVKKLYQNKPQQVTLNAMFVKSLSNQFNTEPVRAKSCTQCKPIQKSQSRANGAKSQQEKKKALKEHT